MQTFDFSTGQYSPALCFTCSLVFRPTFSRYLVGLKTGVVVNVPLGAQVHHPRFIFVVTPKNKIIGTQHASLEDLRRRMSTNHSASALKTRFKKGSRKSPI